MSRLVELNVMEQVVNLFKTGVVQRRRRDTYKVRYVVLTFIRQLCLLYCWHHFS